jgi:hypothetical protein
VKCPINLVGIPTGEDKADGLIHSYRPTRLEYGLQQNIVRLKIKVNNNT